jgi:hypothetical protein
MQAQVSLTIIKGKTAIDMEEILTRGVRGEQLES